MSQMSTDFMVMPNPWRLAIDRREAPFFGLPPASHIRPEICAHLCHLWLKIASLSVSVNEGFIRKIVRYHAREAGAN